VGPPYRLYSKVNDGLLVAKKMIFQSDYSPIPDMMTLLYRTLKLTLSYDTIIQLTWVIAANENFALKIAAKPLQI